MTQTLILVQPQKVPKEFIRSIVSTGIEDRLKTITQQVTSRTNLESIIKEYRLYHDRDMIIDEKVDLIRKQVKINVNRRGRSGGGNAFSISFRGRDPEKVMRVTNALASNFISENLKIRESQALGTSSFLSDELDSVNNRLSRREAKIMAYRKKNLGAMPDQLQTNLRILERLQMHSEQLSNNLRDAENRKLIVQKQVSDSAMIQKQLREKEKGPGPPISSGLSKSFQGETYRNILSLKNELALLKSRYTDSHPDVRRLQQMIKKIEDEEVEPEEKNTQIETLPKGQGPAGSETDSILKTQLRQIYIQIKDFKAEMLKTKSRMGLYQKRIEGTPKKQQELIALNRDYENMKQLYNSMLNRKLEAELAVSMEKKQKGEQFRIVDPAKIPSIPIEPDAQKIIILTLILGMGMGAGLAFLREYMDTSYKTPDEVEKELKLPILTEIPIHYTEYEQKRIKRKKIIFTASVVAGFTISALGIVLSIKGTDRTLNYFKEIIGNI